LSSSAAGRTPDTRGIDAVLRTAVETGAVPNVVATAADRGGLIYAGAAGPLAADRSGAAPVTPDTLFRLASMTKPVTTVAALQLVETGALDLAAPVEEYLPAFADVAVLDGFDGEVPRLRAPATRATVLQLVTHTSGLGYWLFNPLLARWEQVTGTPNVNSGSIAALTAPMVADPGTVFEYGISTDWLGRVVEAVAGTTLDAYLAENVLGPLGMSSATFYPSPEQRAATVPIHVTGPDGAWRASTLDYVPTPDYCPGGHGLFCTPLDYLRFQRALLGGGALEGTRILREETVAAAFRNQIGDLAFPEFPTVDPKFALGIPLGTGWKWGYGLHLNPDDVQDGRAAGSGGWSGLLNSFFWVDPATGITGAVYSQFFPFCSPPAVALYALFERALYAAVRAG
jgi:methyl acetate hydrolase